MPVRHSRLARLPRRSRRIAGAGAALTALAALGTGCSLTDDDARTSKSAYSLNGAATKAVTVDTRGGDIDIVAADGRGDAIRIIERYRWKEQKPHTEHAQKDGRLTLTADDCGGENTCDVSYEVRVPAGAELRLKSGGGDVNVSGVSGSVEADTRGGDIRLDDASSGRVTAHTEGGDLLGTFTAAPRQVSFTSAGGDIDLRLPEHPYAVDATTTGGDREVDIPHDRTADHRVKAHTEGGDIAVTTIR